MSFAMADLRITALPGHTRLETLPAGLAEQRGRLGAVVQLRSVDMAVAAAAVREVPDSGDLIARELAVADQVLG
jgi:hypothetical protein